MKKKHAPKKSKLNRKFYDPDVTKLKRPEPVEWQNLHEMFGFKSATDKEVQKIALVKKRTKRWRNSSKSVD